MFHNKSRDKKYIIFFNTETLESGGLHCHAVKLKGQLGADQN